MTDLQQDDDGGRSVNVGGLWKLVLAGGAVYLVSRGVFGQRQRLNALIDREKEIREDIRNEIENAGGLDGADLQTKAETYENEARVLYDRVGPGNVNISPDELESELAGESWEIRALSWKTYAHRLVVAEIAAEQDENQFLEFFRNALPPWVKQLLAVGAGITTAAAFVALIKRLWDFGSGGGGTGGLGTFTDWVGNGIVGDPGTIDDVDGEQTPEEQPTTDPEGSPTGSPRGVWHDLGLPVDLLIQILNTLGLPASAVVALSQGGVDLIAQVTSLEAHEAQTRPAVFLALALAIAAAAALAAADGPLPVGDAAGIVLVLGVAAALGVSIDRAGVRQVWDDIRSDVGGGTAAFTTGRSVTF